MYLLRPYVLFSPLFALWVRVSRLRRACAYHMHARHASASPSLTVTHSSFYPSQLHPLALP
ncbi:hypothetical protein C8R44DRAFT_818562 [Mycena epipterygia]|nr:hypothetical protein C8R44DRAFT_818562 [Mycena epipterygia]